MPEERGSNTALVVLVVVLIAVLLAVLLFWRTAEDDADIEIDLPDTSSLVSPAPSLVSALSTGARVVYRG